MSRKRRWLKVTLQLCIFSIVLYVLWLTSGGDEKPPLVDSAPSYRQSVHADALSVVSDMSPQSLGVKNWAALEPTFRKSFEYLKARPADDIAVDRPGLKLTWGQLADCASKLLDVLPDLDANPQLLSENFTWFHLAPKTLMTGYYEPILKASLTRTDTFKCPLYGQPDDLKTVDLGAFHPRWKGQTLTYRQGENGIEPYHDRAAIDRQGKLADKGLEIAWVEDPVDAFFLQIEGSGRLELPDGSTRHILYSGKNGHPYVSVGRLLIESGDIPRSEMSMDAIRDFFAKNPDQALEIMDKNPSYVFFRLADSGPVGSLGKILTPMVSVAVDRSWIPLGAILAIRGTLPDEGPEPLPFASLFAAQDTGGAIKGTRCDLFTGSGPRAKYLAGNLQNDADIWLLIKK